jgi:hypothetical protein
LAKLKTLELAFYNAGSEVYLYTIPSGLISIPGYCFYGCSNVAFEDFSGLKAMG